MTSIEPSTAFNAFEKQLQTLCLREFPCGLGKWTENYGKKIKQIEKDKVKSKFSVTLKDYGENFEKTESLEEYVTAKRSPWNLDYSWSDEAKQLREVAVRSPWLIDDNYILQHFKTLRIIDKNVTEIDQNFLRFKNLEELTLSANKLTEVNSRKLPTKLRVLELCANEIRSLTSLCMKPPQLYHLGLGYNQLRKTDDYIIGEYWPHLLSLDLSHNNLCDIIEIIRKLQSLPKLRNLVLQGNPLSLVPGYRGYTVDSLRNLSYLDFINISADERHHYKGLAKHKEYMLDEAKVQLHVGYIKGVPMPEEIKNPEEQPEYPVVTRHYYVQFMYVEDKSVNAEIFQLFGDDEDAMTIISDTGTSPEKGSPQIIVSEDQPAESITEEHASASLLDASELVGQDYPNQRYEEALVEQNAEADEDLGSVAGQELVLNNEDEINSQTLDEENDQPQNKPVKLSSVKTEPCQWQEEMNLNWNKVVVRDDLLAVRDFFKQGMQIDVIEEKILSYPADQVVDGEVSPAPSSQRGKDKKNKKEEKHKEKQGAKDDKKEDKKKDKKKKEPDMEMTSLPPEVTTLAQFNMNLNELSDGHFEVEKIFSINLFDKIEAKNEESESSHKAKKDKKKLAPDKKKEEKDKKDKGGDKSPKGKKDEKMKKSTTAAPNGEEEELLPPPPLEIYIKVKLHHWKTAMDAMKMEQNGELPDSDE